MPVVINGKDGKSGRLFIKNMTDGATEYTELCITSHTTRELAKEFETTGSKSAGYDEFGYGNSHLEGSITAQWISTLNPLDEAPYLRSGKADYAIKAYLHSAAGADLEDGDAINVDGTNGHINLNNLEVTVPADGVIEYKFDWKSSGSYSLITSTPV